MKNKKVFFYIAILFFFLMIFGHKLPHFGAVSHFLRDIFTFAPPPPHLKKTYFLIKLLLLFFVIFEAFDFIFGKNMKHKKTFIVAAAVIFFARSLVAQPLPPHKKNHPPVPPHIKNETPITPPFPAGQNQRNPYAHFQIFHVEEIERDDGEIEIEFNMPLNPESVTRGNILINGLPLPENAFFSFNRKGNKINIFEMGEWLWQEITIEIKNIYSATNLPMKELPALYLGYDDEYEWDKPFKTRWVHQQYGN